MIVDYQITKLESYSYYLGAPIYTSNTFMISYHEDSSFHTYLDQQTTRGSGGGRGSQWVEKVIIYL